MATYAVGDIQGCYEQMRRLLDKAAFDPAQDRLWSVGDMVNRGPGSLQTLRFLKNLGPAFTTVLGNHDLHFLAVASGAKRDGKVQTLQPLLSAPDCTELFEWVRHQPLVHRERLDTTAGPRKFLMVHAGIAPGWKFRQAQALGREVEQALQGKDYQLYLTQMYGDQPDCWQDNLTGAARLRVITNILTRLRFCTPEGRLDMNAKGEEASAPPGYRPWFEFQQLKPDRVLVFGHWAMLDGNTGRANIIGLDTGCVWGRCLTLLRLEDGTRFSVDCHDL